MERIRAAIIVSHPIQHFIHLYRALAKEPSLELLVIYCSDMGARSYFDEDMGVEIAWKTDLLTGYKSVVLSESAHIMNIKHWILDNPSVTRVLGEFRPQIVMQHGYSQLSLLRCLFWCRLHRVPVLLWSDSSLLYRRGLLKRVVKRTVITFLMNQYSGVLTSGDNNEKYYRHYGVPQKKLFRCPFTIDEKLFTEARNSRTLLRKELRARYGLSEDAFVILFVGKLMPWKRPKDVLEALLLLRESHSSSAQRVAAFFAGDGALRPELEAYSSRHNIRAIYGGFINVDILPSIYAMADVLVFPSGREAYGLSAREAISVGLPMIISDQIGCVGPNDAARDRQNAIVYPAGDIKALANGIYSLAGDESLLRRMGDVSLRVAEELNSIISVKGFMRAVHSLC